MKTCDRQEQSMVVFPVWRGRRIVPSSDLCFVLMPFSIPRVQKVFETVVRPALEEAGLSVDRADERHGADVMEDIWVAINEARLVVADVSGRNPNVFYELGIAHTLGKPVVLLSNDPGEDIPFDLKRFRHLLYRTSSIGLIELRGSLARMLPRVLAEFPSGSLLTTQIEQASKTWIARFHDHMMLNMVALLNDVREHVPASGLSDEAIAFSVATAAHCGSPDHLVYWGRICAKREGATAELALMAIRRPEGHERPPLRVARVLEQFPEETKLVALRRLAEHGADQRVAGAIEQRTIIQLVENNDLVIDDRKRAALLMELKAIRL